MLLSDSLTTELVKMENLSENKPEGGGGQHNATIHLLVSKGG